MLEKKIKREQTTFRFPVDLLNQLRLIAKKHGYTVTDILVVAIKEWLKKNEHLLK